MRQVICVHTNLIRLKTIKFYLDKSRNHATMSFCSKICLIFESHFEAIHFTELFKSAYSCAHS